MLFIDKYALQDPFVDHYAYGPQYRYSGRTNSLQFSWKAYSQIADIEVPYNFKGNKRIGFTLTPSPYPILHIIEEENPGILEKLLKSENGQEFSFSKKDFSEIKFAFGTKKFLAFRVPKTCKDPKRGGDKLESHLANIKYVCRNHSDFTVPVYVDYLGPGGKRYLAAFRIALGETATAIPKIAFGEFFTRPFLKNGKIGIKSVRTFWDKQTAQVSGRLLPIKEPVSRDRIKIQSVRPSPNAEKLQKLEINLKNQKESILSEHRARQQALRASSVRRLVGYRLTADQFFGPTRTTLGLLYQKESQSFELEPAIERWFKTKETVDRLRAEITNQMETLDLESFLQNMKMKLIHIRAMENGIASVTDVDQEYVDFSNITSIKEVAFVTTEPYKLNVVNNNRAKISAVYAGPWKVVVTSGQIQISPLNETIAARYCTDYRKLHPHTPEVYLGTWAETAVNGCLGETGSALYTAFESKDIRYILIVAAQWLKSTFAADTWGKTYRKFPKNIKRRAHKTSEVVAFSKSEWKRIGSTFFRVEKNKVVETRRLSRKILNIVGKQNAQDRVELGI